MFCLLNKFVIFTNQKAKEPLRCVCFTNLKISKIPWENTCVGVSFFPWNDKLRWRHLFCMNKGGSPFSECESCKWCNLLVNVFFQSTFDANKIFCLLNNKFVIFTNHSVANNGWSSAIADLWEHWLAKKLGNYKNGQPFFTHTKKDFKTAKTERYFFLLISLFNSTETSFDSDTKGMCIRHICV